MLLLGRAAPKRKVQLVAHAMSPALVLDISALFTNEVALPLRSTEASMSTGPPAAPTKHTVAERSGCASSDMSLRAPSRQSAAERPPYVVCPCIQLGSMVAR